MLPLFCDKLFCVLCSRYFMTSLKLLNLLHSIVCRTHRHFSAVDGVATAVLPSSLGMHLKDEINHKIGAICQIVLQSHYGNARYLDRKRL